MGSQTPFYTFGFTLKGWMEGSCQGSSEVISNTSNSGNTEPKMLGSLSIFILFTIYEKHCTLKYSFSLIFGQVCQASIVLLPSFVSHETQGKSSLDLRTLGGSWKQPACLHHALRKVQASRHFLLEATHWSQAPNPTRTLESPRELWSNSFEIPTELLCRTVWASGFAKSTLAS